MLQIMLISGATLMKKTDFPVCVVSLEEIKAIGKILYGSMLPLNRCVISGRCRFKGNNIFQDYAIR